MMNNDDNSEAINRIIEKGGLGNLIKDFVSERKIFKEALKIAMNSEDSVFKEFILAESVKKTLELKDIINKKYRQQAILNLDKEGNIL